MYIMVTWENSRVIDRATHSPLKISPSDHLQQFFLPWVVSRTIYGTISGSTLPQMVPHVTDIRVILGECHGGPSKAKVKFLVAVSYFMHSLIRWLYLFTDFVEYTYVAHWFIADLWWPIPFPAYTCRYLVNYTIYHAVPETVQVSMHVTSYYNNDHVYKQL